jgi:hypothetical protein
MVHEYISTDRDVSAGRRNHRHRSFAAIRQAPIPAWCCNPTLAHLPGDRLPRARRDDPMYLGISAGALCHRIFSNKAVIGSSATPQPERQPPVFNFR